MYCITIIHSCIQLKQMNVGFAFFSVCIDVFGIVIYFILDSYFCCFHYPQTYYQIYGLSRIVRIFHLEDGQTLIIAVLDFYTTVLQCTFSLISKIYILTCAQVFI